jgi:hypothetical protein
MSNTSIATLATIGLDIDKDSFHVVALDRGGPIVLRQNCSCARGRDGPIRRTASLACTLALVDVGSHLLLICVSG